MSDRIRLGDDGTLDTVLVCKDCGQEARYNYDCQTDFAENPPEDWDECDICGGFHPEGYARDCRDDVNRWPSHACIELLAKESYDAFIEWAIEDFDNEHTCRACELCGEPAGGGGALCPACAESR